MLSPIVVPSLNYFAASSNPRQLYCNDRAGDIVGR
jgi:hypothetical protein